MKHYIGMDIHRKFSAVCRMDESGQIVAERRLWHDDLEGIERFFRESPVGTKGVMEATLGWMWLSDLLEALGMEVHLAHMAGVKVIATSRLKTDRVDARVLAQLLRQMDVPVLTRRILDDQRDLIEHYDTKIGQTDRRLREHLEPDTRRKWVTSMPGIGEVTGTFLLAEIGYIERFPNEKKFVSHAGLYPSTYQSADRTSHAGIRGAGRRLLKWAFVEAAHTAVKKDSYLATIFHRMSRRKTRPEAYVAVARHMAEIVWRLLSEQRPYEPRRKRSQAGPRRPMAAPTVRSAPSM